MADERLDPSAETVAMIIRCARAQSTRANDLSYEQTREIQSSRSEYWEGFNREGILAPADAGIKSVASFEATPDVGQSQPD